MTLSLLGAFGFAVRIRKKVLAQHSIMDEDNIVRWNGNALNHE
jgi:hypothetical protein